MATATHAQPPLQPATSSATRTPRARCCRRRARPLPRYPPRASSPPLASSTLHATPPKCPSPRALCSPTAPTALFAAPPPLTKYSTQPASPTAALAHPRTRAAQALSVPHRLLLPLPPARHAFPPPATPTARAQAKTLPTRISGYRWASANLSTPACSHEQGLSNAPIRSAPQGRAREISRRKERHFYRVSAHNARLTRAARALPHRTAPRQPLRRTRPTTHYRCASAQPLPTLAAPHSGRQTGLPAPDSGVWRGPHPPPPRSQETHATTGAASCDHQPLLAPKASPRSHTACGSDSQSHRAVRSAKTLATSNSMATHAPKPPLRPLPLLKYSILTTKWQLPSPPASIFVCKPGG